MGKNLPEPSRNEEIERLRKELKARDEYYNEGCAGRRSSMDHWTDEEVLRKHIEEKTDHGHGYR